MEEVGWAGIGGRHQRRGGAQGRLSGQAGEQARRAGWGRDAAGVPAAAAARRPRTRAREAQAHEGGREARVPAGQADVRGQGQSEAAARGGALRARQGSRRRCGAAPERLRAQQLERGCRRAGAGASEPPGGRARRACTQQMMGCGAARIFSISRLSSCCERMSL